MSVGRLVHLDLSNSNSIKYAKNYYSSMQDNVNIDRDLVQRYFIVGDSCRCNEVTPRQISFEEAQSYFREVIYVEVNCISGLNMIQVQQMVVERLHGEARVKQRQYEQEQSRNPRVNWCINHIFTFLTTILFCVSGMLIYVMFLWTCIKLTDQVFIAEKWYWEVLSFALGNILGLLELSLLFVGITTLLQDWKTQHEKRYKKKAP